MTMSLSHASHTAISINVVGVIDDRWSVIVDWWLHDRKELREIIINGIFTVFTTGIALIHMKNLCIVNINKLHNTAKFVESRHLLLWPWRNSVVQSPINNHQSPITPTTLIEIAVYTWLVFWTLSYHLCMIPFDYTAPNTMNEVELLT